MKENFCPNYCGLACVDGNCPKIEYGRYHCNECWLYKGCEDCCFKDSEYCDQPRKERELKCLIKN